METLYKKSYGTSTCPFVANKISVYISLKATTVIELLEFYSTNNRKIKSLVVVVVVYL